MRDILFFLYIFLLSLQNNITTFCVFIFYYVSHKILYQLSIIYLSLFNTSFTKVASMIATFKVFMDVSLLCSVHFAYESFILW